MTYVWRDTEKFFEGFTTIDGGTTEVIVGGENFGTFDNVIYRNTNDLKREYQAIQFQSTWGITPRWVTQLNYTHMLKYEGNTEGEAANQPGVTSAFGDYPEIYVQERNFPSGRLSGYQKHKLRFLMNYGLPTGSAPLRWEASTASTQALLTASFRRGSPSPASSVHRSRLRHASR